MKQTTCWFNINWWSDSALLGCPIIKGFVIVANKKCFMKYQTRSEWACKQSILVLMFVKTGFDGYAKKWHSSHLRQVTAMYCNLRLNMSLFLSLCRKTISRNQKRYLKTIPFFQLIRDWLRNHTKQTDCDVLVREPFHFPNQSHVCTTAMLCMCKCVAFRSAAA